MENPKVEINPTILMVIKLRRRRILSDLVSKMLDTSPAEGFSSCLLLLVNKRRFVINK